MISSEQTILFSLWPSNKDRQARLRRQLFPVKCFWSKSDWNAENAAELASAIRQGYSLSESPHRITFLLHWDSLLNCWHPCVARRVCASVCFLSARNHCVRFEGYSLHGSHSSSCRWPWIPRDSHQNIMSYCQLPRICTRSCLSLWTTKISLFTLIRQKPQGIIFLLCEMEHGSVTVAHQHGLWPIVLPIRFPPSCQQHRHCPPE